MFSRAKKHGGFAGTVTVALAAAFLSGCASTDPVDAEPRVKAAKVEPDVGNYGRETNEEALFVRLNQQLRNARDPGTNALAGRQLRTVLERYVGANFEMVAKGLRHQDPGRRMLAAWALGYSRDERALPLLIGSVRDEDARVRANALHAVSLRADVATPLGPLLERFSDDDSANRCNAARAVRDVVQRGRGREAIVPLTGLLADEDPRVRLPAVAALGNIGLPECRGFLVSALRDPVPLVRGQAALGLGKVGDKRSVPAMVSFLESERNPIVMHSLMKSLSALTGESYATAKEWSRWLASRG